MVSIADASIRRSVAPPFDAKHPILLNSPLFPFLQVPFNLDPHIAQLARQITAGASSMYDKAVALETYLRTHYAYNLQVELPPGEEAVSWFLFHSGDQGYCTYFATAMAIMARLICSSCASSAAYGGSVSDPERRQGSCIDLSVCSLPGPGARPTLRRRPYEYMRRLLPLMPSTRAPLERICDLYARERWAHPASPEHPCVTGEWWEVPALWAQLRPELVSVILQR
jgi:Transglutaminase-like superfamily